GGPIAHTRFYVLDAFLQPVPIGVAGELFIGGVGLARGYLHCPDITAERFVPDLFSKVPGERLYRTGDLVRYREDGNLEFVGRVDNQIKLRGYRIELEEIEIVLKRHPQVRDAVVVMRHDARNEKWLVAYIVLRGENLALETLRSFLAQHLPAYMIPSAFVTLEQLPLTSHGKVDRQALPNPSNERPAMGAIYVAPQTLIEAQIAHVWEEILGVERVGIDDDFFVLGGHSLKAVQVVSRIHEQLAVRLSLRELFAHPTVRMLAQQVEHAEREALQTIPHVPAARAYALSPAQQRFWLINQLEAASTAYNIQLAIPIRGTINCEALETVLRQLIERHESLRTSFHFEQNNPVQVIGITPQHPLTIIDVRSLASEVTRQLGEKLSRDAMQVPFALDTPPLLRAVWLWTGAQEGILHITLHHIICDGWSLEMFEREFRACYQARVQGWSLSLPSLPIHYKDYATWQNAQLSSEAMLEHQRFWLEYLRPPFPSLILPGDYTHDRSEQRKGASYRFILQGEAYERLKAVAIEQQVSIFMIFVASLTAWLACLTGQRDVIVATPVAGREHAAVKHLFGLFLNTLILRNQVDTEDTFATLLQRVRTSTLEAMQHQAYPFERLLEVLGVERQLDHFPLTPVLINMLNFPREQLPHTPTGWTGLFDAGNDVKNDVNCYVREYQDGIDLICNYRVSLFKPATIVYLLEEYRLFLIEAVQSPHASLATLAPFRVERLTSQREQNDSLQSYEQYGGIYESYMQSGDLYTHFLRQAQIYRDKLAVVTAQRSYTYGQLEEHTLRIGSALLPCIAQKQYPVRVALLFAHSPQMIAAMLGVLGAGAAYVPLDAASPVRRLHTILRESRPVLLLTDTANLPLAQQLQGLYPLSCLDVDQLDSIQEYEWRGV
ncbi:MAG: AMP-binding protein, partial [Ktedonobacteraceae bacterium]|nr:AMP-binding protein [Ktedonobacteraceae bacterium]